MDGLARGKTLLYLCSGRFNELTDKLAHWRGVSLRGKTLRWNKCDNDCWHDCSNAVVTVVSQPWNSRVHRHGTSVTTGMEQVCQQSIQFVTELSEVIFKPQRQREREIYYILTEMECHGIRRWQRKTHNVNLVRILELIQLVFCSNHPVLIRS